MKSAILILIIVPSVCLLVSVLLYLINRGRYNNLISDFQNNYSLPAPYSLHCNMGYLGSPLMTYFFVRLKERKKIFFIEKNSQAYNFPVEGENYAAINKLKPLYYSFLIGFVCCLLLGMIALLIRTSS